MYGGSGSGLMPGNQPKRGRWVRKLVKLSVAAGKNLDRNGRYGMITQRVKPGPGELSAGDDGKKLLVRAPPIRC